MNVFAELRRFQEDRGLDKHPFNIRTASLNIIEELLEAHGVIESKERKLTKDIYMAIEALIETSPVVYTQEEVRLVDFVTNKMLVDAFCDIQTFAGGEVGKLGYINELAMNEVAKEINSREGEMYQGKFTKHTTPEAKAKWYEANFTKALKK